jgi:hypothetical protein
VRCSLRFRATSAASPIYAVELRNAELLTPRFVKMLREAGARLTIGVHSRMPPAARQSIALRAMDATEEEGDDWRMKGPLVVRWNLASGFRYDEAKSRYAPFDRLIDPDIPTRGTLVHLVHVAIKSGQPSFVIANNKAEGSAPLTLVELAKGDGLLEHVVFDVGGLSRTLRPRCGVPRLRGTRRRSTTARRRFLRALSFRLLLPLLKRVPSGQ